MLTNPVGKRLQNRKYVQIFSGGFRAWVKLYEDHEIQRREKRVFFQRFYPVVSILHFSLGLFLSACLRWRVSLTTSRANQLSSSQINLCHCVRFHRCVCNPKGASKVPNLERPLYYLPVNLTTTFSDSSHVFPNAAFCLSVFLATSLSRQARVTGVFLGLNTASPFLSNVDYAHLCKWAFASDH